MATLWSRCLPSILLVIMPSCFAPATPAFPSPPQCHIPCPEDDCAEIHCSLDPRPHPEIPTNYSLHWEPANSDEGRVLTGTPLSGIIHREDFTRGELRVWVQAEDRNGSAKSQDASFHTADIIKLPPPKISSVSHQELLEISWTIPPCDDLQLSFGQCDVRYRTEADRMWLEDENVHVGYTIENPQASTEYEFQVRCSCGTGLKSDWSEIHSVRSKEAAPEGALDVWSDCGISQESCDCFVTWKELPKAQARGHIRGYRVRLSHNAPVEVNMSTDCEKKICRFRSPLKDVSSVSVSAYNACGATSPSSLALPTPGKHKSERAVHLVMNEENLTVSWEPPSQGSDHLKEHVVQYKEAGRLPGQGFDWIKVGKGIRTGIFEGPFTKYKAYQVSLFTVSNSNNVHHLSSVIGYSLQGPPPKVPSFEVSSIAATHVNLLWESIPLPMQTGKILYYQLIVESGAGGQKVFNVSVSPQQKKQTFELRRLSPGQDYEVRIRAVTPAGPGANETAKFKTNHHEPFEHIIALVLGAVLLVFICILFVFCSACRGEKKTWCLSVSLPKVPDARNSHIFRHMKHQMNDSFPWIFIPVYEPHPKISVLEVVEVQPWASESSVEKISDPDGSTKLVAKSGCSRAECRDDQREEAVREESHRYGREEYSQMVDSDEERDKEEEEDRADGWSSSEEEQSSSGYEKHFMPTALEVQEA
uniref:interleukin 12 receptor, beta 2a, like n=1 Tax=Gasterosteus aculeatus aculeatus TaxID=481459 RepID=UPI001A9A2A0C|nr:interleukin 12 receptor, beta 2a, like [Gasterosteus aculeatus aculeatus]